MKVTTLRINYAINTLGKIGKILTSELITYRYYQLLHTLFFGRSYFRSSWKSDIDKVLEQLSFRERITIQERFGLDNGEPKSLEVVATKFGVTRERVRQIEGKALRRLRHPTRRLALLGIEEKAKQKPSPVIITKTINDISIEELELPTRIFNALRNYGYKTIEEVVNTRTIDLLKIRNIGLKSIYYLRDCLRSKGLDIKE